MHFFIPAKMKGLLYTHALGWPAWNREIIISAFFRIFFENYFSKKFQSGSLLA